MALKPSNPPVNPDACGRAAMHVGRGARAGYRERLGIMDFDTSVMLLQLGGYAMLTHVACTIGLRVLVRAGQPGFEKLFTSPFWGELIGTPWHMPVRYFMPWVAAPKELYETPGLAIALFWAARIAGGLFVLGIVGFMASMIYMGFRNA